MSEPASDIAENVALALAADLGVAVPRFAKAAHPELFAGWTDRLALAAWLKANGRLTPADLDECDRHLGVQASRVAPVLEQVIAAGVAAGTIVDLREALGRKCGARS